MAAKLSGESSPGIARRDHIKRAAFGREGLSNALGPKFS